MTRVVAGRAGGRRLVVPAGSTTRPTSERVREAMFSALTAMLDGWDDVRVLDLYAGSGALGLEALSRGAQSCLFVENDRRALAALNRNVSATGLSGATVMQGDAAAVVSSRPESDIHLVLLDPPYALPPRGLTEVLGGLVTNRWLAPDAVVVVERSAREEPPAWPAGVTSARDRRYGETRLWYLRWSDDSSRPAS